MALFSFIIPVYNGEKTIEKCINSIQTLDEGDIEICVIDDGSIDSTNEILKRLCLIDYRIVVLSSTHKGVCYARNLGIKKARGRYISFVDCDDYIKTDAYNRLIETIKKIDVDIFCCNYVKFCDSRFVEVNRKFLSLGINKPNVLYDELMTGIFNSVWSNIYRLDLIKKLGILFDEHMKMGEDLVFNVNYCLNCKTVYYFDESTYCYNSNNLSSVTHSCMPEYLNDYILMFESYKKIIDLSTCRELLLDRKYYLAEVYKCLRVSNKAQVNPVINDLKDSFLYSEVIQYRYSNFSSIIYKFLIKIYIKGLRLL